jgi:imidazolonepropionase-like amidohydrolase
MLPALLLVAAPLGAQTDTVIAIRGGTVHTAAGAPIDGGVIVIRGGKIAAIGRGITIPRGARVIDATGRHVVPGMIDNHSHIGAKTTDLNDSPMLIGPQHRFLDALDLHDKAWSDAIEGGVTTIVTGPGSGENVSGMAVVIKTFGDDLDDRLLLERGGMKFAMGPKGSQRYPTTAMGVAANLRQYLIKTQEYVAARKKWEDDGQKGNQPARDLGYALAS